MYINLDLYLTAEEQEYYKEYLWFMTRITISIYFIILKIKVSFLNMLNYKYVYFLS